MPQEGLEEQGPSPNSSTMPEAAPASPCINICALDAHGTCLGCYRTITEIARWGDMNPAEKRAVLQLTTGRCRQAGLQSASRNAIR
jgi:uncharacterized protein